MTTTCIWCVFWQPIVPDASQCPVSMGACKRHAPVVDHTTAHGRWPAVRGRDWCGDWTGKMEQRWTGDHRDGAA